MGRAVFDLYASAGCLSSGAGQCVLHCIMTADEDDGDSLWVNDPLSDSSIVLTTVVSLGFVKHHHFVGAAF